MRDARPRKKLNDSYQLLIIIFLFAISTISPALATDISDIAKAQRKAALRKQLAKYEALEHLDGSTNTDVDLSIHKKSKDITTLNRITIEIKEIL